MGTDAGFIFSLCAGILVGLRLFVWLQNRKTKSLVTEEKSDHWQQMLYDPLTYAIRQEEKPSFLNFLKKRGYDPTGLERGIFVINRGRPFVYLDNKVIEVQKEKSQNVRKLNKDQMLYDLWYGTGG